GKILGHILNPKTGRPVDDPPLSVTVAGPTCTEAGLWSTLAVLQGDRAETLLKDQGLEFWCFRLIAVFFLGLSLAHAATVGAPAPKFSHTNSQKQLQSPASYKGKILFINFWASWCAPCLQELPELNRLAGEDFHGKVKVLAINVDEDPKAARK